VTAALHTVHVRVNDAATGQPTPVRVRITDDEGFYYAPFGRLTNFAGEPNEDVGGNVLVGSLRHSYIDGSCEIRLPSGTLLVEVDKGPEYQPLRREVKLGTGQIALRLAIERWIDLRKEGWYPGDAHVEFMTPHAALLEAAAEDLAVVNLLARVCPAIQGGLMPPRSPAISNILAFSGQGPALQMPGHMVVVNTLNGHPVLGSLALLNSHRPIYPLTFGGPDSLDNWSLAAWCDQCHRKGGLVVWTGAWRDDTGFTSGEALADLILGKVDALEIQPTARPPFDLLDDWYGLLNCGYRVPLVGGSGKNSNSIVLGSMRTYARLNPDEEFTYKGWIEAIRAGRTFVTSRPLLSFTVNGQDPGATIALPANASTVRIRAEARSVIPLGQLELVADGVVLKSATASGSPSSALIEMELPIASSGWLAARCTNGSGTQPVFAHTSPIYLTVDGRLRQPDAVAAAKLHNHLDKMTTWIESEGRFENDKQRRDLLAIFESARAKLPNRLH
jgi:hypothetical protein